MYYNVRQTGRLVTLAKSVQPIKDSTQLEQYKSILKRISYRDFMLFLIGINTGLRISDLLPLQVGNVKYQTHICIVEQKTGKEKRARINQNLRRQIDEYIEGMHEDDYLFPSRKGGHIGRIQAYRKFNEAAAVIGLQEVGTHTMRKTFGYHHYRMYRDVAVLQRIFNHSSPSQTLRYIGIDQDEMDQTLDQFNL